MQQLALTKKVNLSDVADGWDNCYAVVRLATRDESTEALGTKVQKMKQADAEVFELGFIKDHFISGKVLVFTDEKKMELADMEADHFDTSWKLANLVYYEILGIAASPKVSQKETPTINER